jgi:putative transcriptional regulator
MIRCHLSRMMGERKLKIADVARETGLHRNTITLLYNETANRWTWRRSTASATCLRGVGDLFERVSDDSAP